MAGTPLPLDFKAEKILVRGVNWLGDAVMTIPALRRLRERFPVAEITLLTAAKLGDLWKQQPFLNAVLTFAEWEGPLTVGRRLRSGRFDTAIVLPNSPRSALEIWLARIPCRLGYAGPWRSWCLSTTLASRPGRVPMRKHSVREVRRRIRLAGAGAAGPGSLPPGAHQMHDYLHLVAALGANPAPLAPKLDLGAAAVAAARDGLIYKLAGRSPGPQNPESRIWLGLNPGAAYGAAKRWPIESFAAVAREVSRQAKDVSWLIFGASGDLALCQQLVRLTDGNAFSLAGQTTLAELMALLKLCRVLVTNDSGPMHLAAALGTSVVAPFGSTSFELTGPGLPGETSHRLLTAPPPCSPCFRRSCPIDHRCMTGITPAQVTRAVLDLL